MLSSHAFTTLRSGRSLGLGGLSPLRGHIVKKQIHDLLGHIVLGHCRGLVSLTMLISESDCTVRGAFFLPGEGGLAPGAHEARRRNVPLAEVMGLATHELIVELSPDAGSIKTI